MMIPEITMNRLREVNSIRLNINNNLIDYIGMNEGVSKEDTPFSIKVILD